MNCHQFQDQLFEYVEDSLAPDLRGAADGHLATCADCRQRLRQEQRASQVLARGFRQSTAHLALAPDFAGRLLREVRPKPQVSGFSLRDTLLRFAWPVAMSAGVLIACIHSVRLFPEAPGPVGRPSEPVAGVAVTPVSIDMSYRLPAWQFHREGNRVVDTLSYETVVASGKLQPGGPTTISPQPETKIPL